MWLPYNDSVVDDWFTKETPYLLRTENECVRIAALHANRNSYYNKNVEYLWVTPEGRIIPRNTITHYMVIPV
jgi:hypothetical protein